MQKQWFPPAPKTNKAKKQQENVQYHDAHVHLSKSTMYRKIDELRQTWQQNNVKTLQAMSMTLHESKRSLTLAQNQPTSHQEIYPGIGKHPWKAKKPLTPEETDAFTQLAKDSRCAVIGEVGLDHHWVEQTERYPHQQETFEFFVQLSLETNKPLNIHSKGAEEQVYKTLKEYGIDWGKVNIHWYSGPEDILEKLANKGTYFSVGPAIHYSKHREVVRKVDLDQLLTESDGDVKYKAINLVGEPAIIPKVVLEIANMLQKESQEIADQLYKNAKTYLQIK